MNRHPNTAAVKTAIKTALSQFRGDDFVPASVKLLEAMSYHSDRAPGGQTGKTNDFIKQFPAQNPDTQSEKKFHKDTQSVRVIFQLTDTEITDKAHSQTGNFDKGNIKSFLFAAVELKSGSYPRGRYAQFTREINKRFSMPTVVLFKTPNNLLTLAFAHRRPHKHAPERDVIGSVSLVREIDLQDPHRAHLDVLEELSLYERLKWIKDKDKPDNFDGLLAAWLDALDTEKLNERFYEDLFAWFERAVKTATFPKEQAKTIPPEEHVIRLITRLLFIWFIKEKGLIDDALFDETQISKLLKNYNSVNGDSYYRAVLQNLFFATLNTEIAKRRFSKKSNSTHRNFSCYRYKDEIKDPKSLLALFAKTPFINGGLFDCLDSEEATGDGGYRIDCFTDNPAHRRDYSIPNHLFFDDSATDQGLIPLFDKYKFTVEESTPIDQEVALDPELLGKVFENLLATITARKPTGSYYTPRAVVDYMVDEALVGALAQQAQPEDSDTGFWQERLRYLLDYDDAFNDAETLFTEVERATIVRAIANIKVLDPAVGSGAFPMGVLHKLTLALRRLDPGNRHWEKLQRDRSGQQAETAFKTDNKKERDEKLKKISETFEHYRDSDFGRKLYLIRNSIFGVDIQPIACQIAKLRFFISLAIEQEPNPNALNFGIKPLPNLETRFIAADTLIGLEAAQRKIGQDDDAVRQLEAELTANRERHFHATTRSLKLACREKDKELRNQLAKLLKTALPTAVAEKIAHWDPYDQNAKADWFDAKRMFGVNGGFDIVIGNPPYVESRNNLLSDSMKDLYGSQVLADWREKLPRGGDLLIYFYARTPKLLHDSGLGCFITHNAWLSTDYGKKFQDFSLGKFSFKKIVDTTGKFFSDSNSQNINAIITIFSQQLLPDIEYQITNNDMDVIRSKTIASRQAMKWGHAISMPQFFIDILSTMTKHANAGVKLSFGQGLNFALSELDEKGATVPVIIKNPRFVAESADGWIHKVSSTRENKVPALIMPRGIGNRYYCTFNSCRAFSHSGVEIYLEDSLWESDLHYCLWAYLNSSLVWLFRETTGRKNLGGGMLKAEATDMKTLPVDFNFNFAKEAKKVHAMLKNREPLPVYKEIHTNEHLMIDHMVANFLGISDMQENIRRSLLEQVNFRTAKPKGKK